MRNAFTRLMAAVLLVMLLVPGLPITARAAEETGGVTLANPDEGELLPFHATNLFPGDSVTKDYLVTTVHKNPVTLYYRADVRPDARYQKLAEVLQIRIQLPQKNITLYEGLMRDMPHALSHQLAPEETKILYRITVFLDTSAGNDYMDKELMADFRWWYLDEEGIPVTITAEKTLDSRYARGSDFTFELKDEQGLTASRVSNIDGHIEFDTLYFTAPGTYTYTFSEVAGRDSGITYDPTVYKAVITITEQEGQASASVTYYRNGAVVTALPRFTNVTKGQTLPQDPSDVQPSNPKTGDDFPLYIFVVICLSALTALICLLLLRRDREKEGQP